jgi:hypothetical protein
MTLKMAVLQKSHFYFVYSFKTNTFRAYNAPPSGALVWGLFLYFNACIVEYIIMFLDEICLKWNVPLWSFQFNFFPVLSSVKSLILKSIGIYTGIYTDLFLSKIVRKSIIHTIYILWCVSNRTISIVNFLYLRKNDL